MKRFNLCLSNDQFAAFSRRAKLQNTSRSAVARAALDLYFQLHAPVDRKAELQGLFGAWRDMPEQAGLLRALRSEERDFA
jgi:hypothetical protein